MNELWDRLDPGFLAPIWLAVGLLAMIAIVLLEIGATRRRRQAIALFAAPSLIHGLTGSVSRPRRLLKRFLLVSGVGLLFVAMARPHLFFDWSEEARTGLDLFLAVDCSKSMLTQDVKPNRIERAKLAVEDFADHVPNNRLGLLAFAGDAFLECPLTLDHEAFLSAVRDLDTDTIPRPGTDIAGAIDEAVVALKSQPNNLKFMILITDGEDLEGRVLSAAKAAAQEGLKIYTIGVGTAEGGMIPENGDTGPIVYHQDANGETVTSKLDESTLRQIAQLTGGAYEPLGQRGEGLENIYQRYIATLPKQHLEERRDKIRYERFEWPLSLAILFLITEFLIRDRARTAPRPIIVSSTPRTRTRRRAVASTTAAVPAVLAGLSLVSAMSAGRAATVDTAERDYKAGNYGDAAQKYGEALQAQPNRRDLEYDRGDAAYKAGGFNEAEEAFRKALETPDLDLQENAYYNLGNTQFRHGEAMEKDDSKRARELWEQSLHSYESALKLKNAADTKYNYEVVKKRLEELKKQQQQQGKGNQQQDQDQKQSSQNSPNGQGNPSQQQQNQPGQENPQNSQDQSQQQQGNQQKPGNNGDQKTAQQQPSSDKNAPPRQQARSVARGEDQRDPGVKNREEAEALLDSLKDDEHSVTARSLNGGNQPPPTPSGKDW